MSETWRPIPSIPEYAVSDLGSIRSVRTEILLKTCPRAVGKSFFSWKKNKKASHRVKIAVYEAFRDILAEDWQIRPRNGNEQDCRLENLEYRKEGFGERKVTQVEIPLIRPQLTFDESVRLTWRGVFSDDFSLVKSQGWR